MNEPIISTVGVDLKKIKLAEGEVMLFDFAGQVEYTATHQFFISKEASFSLSFFFGILIYQSLDGAIHFVLQPRR